MDSAAFNEKAASNVEVTEGKLLEIGKEISSIIYQ